MPKGSTCLHPGDVVNHCGQLHPPLALTPLTERLGAQDGFTQPLPCSALVSGIRSNPALVGWSLGLPGSLWLFADDGWHHSKAPGISLGILTQSTDRLCPFKAHQVVISAGWTKDLVSLFYKGRSSSRSCLMLFKKGGAHMYVRGYTCVRDHSCWISPVAGLIISLTSFGFDSAAISAPCISFIFWISIR